MQVKPSTAKQSSGIVEQQEQSPSQLLDERQQARVAATYKLIGWILQGGVIISATIIMLGLIMMSFIPNKFTPQELQSFPHTFTQVWTGLLTFQPQSVIMLGLLLLMATPVIRVAVSIVAFAVERDLRMVVITSVVLLILLYSIFYIGAYTAAQHQQLFQHSTYNWAFPLMIFFGAIAAGLLGSLVGLGGGVLIVPLLTLVFGFPIYFAVGASIISVIATSSGAAAAYVKDHMTNLRVGTFLGLATTTGAICGAFLAGLLAPGILSVVFGIILFTSAAPLVFKIGEELPKGVRNDRLASWLHLNSTYPDHYLHRDVPYEVTRTPIGLAMMYVAGLISGLLGIGSGTFKVLALDVAMRLPMKVSSTTSNFMIGVTAAASVGIYFSRGEILPLIAAPVALGILIGALIGARLLTRLSNKVLRIVFLVVIIVSATEMVLHGLGIA